MRKTKTYSPELKAQIIEIAKTSDMPLSRVAQDLRMSKTTLHGWIKEAERKGITQNIDAAEVKRLRRENTILKEERDILKKAMAIFSKNK